MGIKHNRQLCFMPILLLQSCDIDSLLPGLPVILLVQGPDLRIDTPEHIQFPKRLFQTIYLNFDFVIASIRSRFARISSSRSSASDAGMLQRYR